MRNRVKEFLEERSMSAYAFIKKTGIADTTGYKLAKDASHLPSIRVLETLCETFQVQATEFVVWEPSIHEQQ
ncbi:MAG: helix-turn-helix transcriptional regulator [Cyanobacteria bacterium J06648_11]